MAVSIRIKTIRTIGEILDNRHVLLLLKIYALNSKPTVRKQFKSQRNDYNDVMLNLKR